MTSSKEITAMLIKTLWLLPNHNNSSRHPLSNTGTNLLEEIPNPGNLMQETIGRGDEFSLTIHQYAIV